MGASEANPNPNPNPNPKPDPNPNPNPKPNPNPHPQPNPNQVGASEGQLRAAVERVRTLRLLHVSLDAAEAVQPCLESEAAQQQMQQLLDLLFRFKWCWRPEEMLKPRNTSVPGEPVDVCVWGFEPIVGPPSCSRRPTPATCETPR